jgi:hypothetical protein
MGRQVHVMVLQGFLEVERHSIGGGALNLYHVVGVIVLEQVINYKGEFAYTAMLLALLLYTILFTFYEKKSIFKCAASLEPYCQLYCQLYCPSKSLGKPGLKKDYVNITGPRLVCRDIRSMFNFNLSPGKSDLKHEL